MSGAENIDGNRGWFSSFTSSVMSFGKKVIQVVTSPIKLLTSIESVSQYSVAAVKAVGMTFSLAWLISKLTREKIDKVPHDLWESTEGDFDWRPYLIIIIPSAAFIFNYTFKLYQMRYRHTRDKQTMLEQEQEQEQQPIILDINNSDYDPEQLASIRASLNEYEPPPYVYPKLAFGTLVVLIPSFCDFILSLSATLELPLPIVLLLGVPGCISMTLQDFRLALGSIPKDTRLLGTDTAYEWLEWFQRTPPGNISELYGTFYRLLGSKLSLFNLLNDLFVNNYILEIVKWLLVLNPLSMVPKWGNNQARIKERDGSVIINAGGILLMGPSTFSYCLEDSALYINGIFGKLGQRSLVIEGPAYAILFLAELLAYRKKHLDVCKAVVVNSRRVPANLVNYAHKLGTCGFFSVNYKPPFEYIEHSEDEEVYDRPGAVSFLNSSQRGRTENYGALVEVRPPSEIRAKTYPAVGKPRLII